MPKFIALLRGINIGSHNRIAMPDLKAGLADLGFTNASTYVQSGNAIFSSPSTDTWALASSIKGMILTRFGHDVPVIVVSAADLHDITKHSPFFEKDLNKLHVTFLAGVPTKEHLATLPHDAGRGDQWQTKDAVVYLYCPINYGETTLTNAFFEKKLGLTATTRNWKTVTTLAELTSNRE